MILILLLAESVSLRLLLYKFNSTVRAVLTDFLLARALEILSEAH
jgi:hypothetical protein